MGLVSLFSSGVCCFFADGWVNLSPPPPLAATDPHFSRIFVLDSGIAFAFLFRRGQNAEAARLMINAIVSVVDSVGAVAATGPATRAAIFIVGIGSTGVVVAACNAILLEFACCLDPVPFLLLLELVLN